MAVLLWFSLCLLYVSSTLGYFYDSYKPTTNIQETWALVWRLHGFCEEVLGEESWAEGHCHPAVTGQCARGGFLPAASRVSWVLSKDVKHTWDTCLLLCPMCVPMFLVLWALAVGFISVSLCFLTQHCPLTAGSNVCKSKVPELLENIITSYKC